ncbi:unnamed protein product [Caretta caretta]
MTMKNSNQICYFTSPGENVMNTKLINPSHSLSSHSPNPLSESTDTVAGRAHQHSAVEAQGNEQAQIYKLAGYQKD